MINGLLQSVYQNQVLVFVRLISVLKQAMQAAQNKVQQQDKIYAGRGCCRLQHPAAVE